MKYVVFVDLETTGLNPNLSQVLEIGAALVVGDLDSPDSGFVPEDGDTVKVLSTFELLVKAPDEQYPCWDTFALDMHKKSGLLDLCRGGGISPDESDAVYKFSIWLRKEMEKYQIRTPLDLAGNSIHFDRSFLKERMSSKTYAELFSHRNLDVSSFRILSQLFGIPSNFTVEKKPHRALDDIRLSTKELSHWLGKLSRVSNGSEIISNMFQII